MRAAAKEYGWNLNYGGIALMWRGGCIIRSRFLGKIKDGVRQQSEADEPAAGRLFPGRNQTLPERLAQHRGHGGQARHSRFRRSAPRWRSTTNTAAPSCRRICCRRSAIISAPILTSGWTSRAANFSTRTGRAAAAPRRRAPTPFNRWRTPLLEFRQPKSPGRGLRHVEANRRAGAVWCAAGPTTAARPLCAWAAPLRRWPFPMLP